MFKDYEYYSGYCPLPKSGFEETYIPDDLLNRLNNFFISRNASEFFAEQDGNYSFNAPSTMATHIPLRQSRQQTTHALAKISDEFTNLQIEAKDRNVLYLFPTKKGQHGYGWCVPTELMWHYDHTINDMIYLTHEFGHYAGHRRSGPDGAPHCITEWQAHFMQHVQYDRMIEGNFLNAASKQATIEHRFLEASQDYNNFVKGIDAARRLNTKHYAPNQYSALEKQNEKLHYHASAYFFSLALYDRFIDASPNDQKKLVDALYHNGRNARPQNILHAFALDKDGELETTIERQMNNLKKAAPCQKQSAAILFNFKNP